ncbi:hypothetical protein DZB86_28995 [Bacillus sp. RC]|nr:hypothetical protein DZB86_28995 [Bacillus sp. RC]
MNRPKVGFFQIISVPYRIIFFIIKIAIKYDAKLYPPSPTQKAHDRKKFALKRASVILRLFFILIIMSFERSQ